MAHISEDLRYARLIYLRNIYRKREDEAVTRTWNMELNRNRKRDITSMKICHNKPSTIITWLVLGYLE